MKGLVVSAKGAEERDLIEYDGVLVRRDWGPDIGVLKEWAPVYRCLESRIPGHRVMDIGGNIGMFSTKALKLGAEHVVAFEPEPGAFSVLSANLMGKNAIAYNVAVGATNGTVRLSVSPSGNATSATTMVHVNRRQSIEVPKVSFLEMVEQYRPTFLKVDCEGAELEFLDGYRMPACVKVVTAELHREFAGWESLCQRVIGSFSEWTAIKKPLSYSFHRCWLINYERP
jgi:FkbM family methyltransferase